MKKPARIDDAWVFVGRNWPGVMILGFSWEEFDLG